MNLSEMPLEELIHEAEKRQHGSEISDYMQMYGEMLKRLKDINMTVYKQMLKNLKNLKSIEIGD